MRKQRVFATVCELRDEAAMRPLLRRILGKEYVHVIQHAAAVMHENAERIESAPDSDGYDDASIRHAWDCARRMGLLAGAVTRVDH